MGGQAEGTEWQKTGGGAQAEEAGLESSHPSLRRPPRLPDTSLLVTAKGRSCVHCSVTPDCSRKPAFAFTISSNPQESNLG